MILTKVMKNQTKQIKNNSNERPHISIVQNQYLTKELVISLVLELLEEKEMKFQAANGKASIANYDKMSNVIERYYEVKRVLKAI